MHRYLTSGSLDVDAGVAMLSESVLLVSSDLESKPDYRQSLTGLIIASMETFSLPFNVQGVPAVQIVLERSEVGQH